MTVQQKRFFIICTAFIISAIFSPLAAFAAFTGGPGEDYNLEIGYDSGKVTVTNNNSFIVNDITVTISNAGTTIHNINSLKAGETWVEGIPARDYGVSYKPFNEIGAHWFTGNHEPWPNLSAEARAQRVHARVPFAEPITVLKKVGKTIGTVNVSLEFLPLGPRVFFNGHSFTGYWDSSYWYFRQLAEAAGWNAQVAYAYYGGSGIAWHSGLNPAGAEQAVQTKAVFAANDYYDFYSVAGNSDEGVITANGAQNGSSPYSQRVDMLAGAKILYQRAKDKGARMILWSTRGYRYGFYYSQTPKPQLFAEIGNIVKYTNSNTGDVTYYTQMLSSRGHARKNANWYEELATKVYYSDTEPDAQRPLVAHIGTAYDYINTNHPDINPYLPSDQAHQNNIGNYIAACVYYALIFDESPEGLYEKMGGLETNTLVNDPTRTSEPFVDFPTAEQAAIIEQVARIVVLDKGYVLQGQPAGDDEVYSGEYKTYTEETVPKVVGF